MAGLSRVRGLVLREVPVGEADRLLTILTAEQGRITAAARGARRQNSRLVSSTEILSLCDFRLFGKGGRYTVDDAERVETFAPIKADLVRLTCAAHVAELVLDACREDDPSPGVYRLVLRTLAMLSKKEREPLLSVHAFGIRLMTLIGFAPGLNGCMSCGEPPAMGAPVRFSYTRCGLVCSRDECLRRSGESVTIRAGTLACLRHVAGAPEESLFSFSVDPEIRKEFFALSVRYVAERMDKEYRKLGMIDAWVSDPSEPAQDEGGGSS